MLHETVIDIKSSPHTKVCDTQNTKYSTHKIQSIPHTKYKVCDTQNTKRVAQNINSFQSVLHLSHQLTLEEGETMDSQLQTKNDIGLYIDLLLQWSYWLREQVKSHIWVRQLFYLPNIGSQSSHQSSLINISAFQILVYVRLFWLISSFLLSFLVCWPLYWPISSGLFGQHEGKDQKTVKTDIIR